MGAMGEEKRGPEKADGKCQQGTGVISKTKALENSRCY